MAEQKKAPDVYRRTGLSWRALLTTALALIGVGIVCSLIGYIPFGPGVAIVGVLVGLWSAMVALQKR
jgi:hypothetical protein